MLLFELLGELTRAVALSAKLFGRVRFLFLNGTHGHNLKLPVPSPDLAHAADSQAPLHEAQSILMNELAKHYAFHNQCNDILDGIETESESESDSMAEETSEDDSSVLSDRERPLRKKRAIA